MDYTEGDFLADVARTLHDAGNRLVVAQACADQQDTDMSLATIKLAMVLRRHPITQFRSIAEGWDLQRIVRELY